MKRLFLLNYLKLPCVAYGLQLPDVEPLLVAVDVEGDLGRLVEVGPDEEVAHLEGALAVVASHGANGVRLHHGVGQDDGETLPVPELVLQQADQALQVVSVL